MQLLRTTTAAPALTAAQNSPRVEILAYDGGEMPIAGYGATVIDLAGLEIPATVPLLPDHRNEVDAILGQGRPSIRDGKQLIVVGELTQTTEAGRQILALAQEGIALQASVGIEPIQIRQLRPGQSATVNGRNIQATKTVTLVTQGHLREISICALGADRSTTVAIAASLQEGILQMKTSNIHIQPAPPQDPSLWQRMFGPQPAAPTPDQILAADRERIQALDLACDAIQAQTNQAGLASHLLALRQQAITSGATAEQIQPALETLRAQAVSANNAAELAAERARRPAPVLAGQAPAIHAHRAPSELACIEAALVTKAGHSQIVEEHYGANVLDQAHSLAKASLPDLLAAALRITGQTVPHSRDEMIRAAMSNKDVQVSLSNASHLSVLAGYRDAASPIPQICAIRSADNFKDHTSIRPSFGFDLDQVAKGGDLHHGDAGESTFTWNVDTYGKVFSVDRKDVINDSVQIWNEVAPTLGRAAKRKENDLFVQTLLAATSAYFDTTLGNDSTDVFDVPALAARIAAMREQRHLQNDLDLAPATLYVPPALESDAKAALESEYLQRLTDTDKGPTGNPLRNSLKLFVDSRLSNSDKYGASATDTLWYLFAQPADAALIFAYLNGKQTPTVEFFGLDTDPNKLAVTWRVYHDFGCALGDYRAAQRSTGAGS